MARITVDSTLMGKAIADAHTEIKRAIARAMAEFMVDPPAGFVRVHVSAIVNRERIKDEAAFGAFLVNAAKRNAQEDE